MGTSGVLPSRMPLMSMLITSSERSGRVRCMTACWPMASSVSPPAASMSALTVLMWPPAWYMPGRKTAPMTCTMF